MEKTEIATVVYLLKEADGVLKFYLAQKKQDIHKDNGETLANTARWNGYGGKLDPTDGGSVRRCATRELKDESGVFAREKSI